MRYCYVCRWGRMDYTRPMRPVRPGVTVKCEWTRINRAARASLQATLKWEEVDR